MRTNTWQSKASVMIKAVLSMVVPTILGFATLVPIYAMPTVQETTPLQRSESHVKANGHYRAGIIAYEDEAYRAALTEFELAYDAYGELGLWWNQLATNTYIVAVRQKIDGGEEAHSDEANSARDSAAEGINGSDTGADSTPAGLEDPITKLQALFDEARKLRSDGKAEEALTTYESALTVAEALGDNLSIGRILSQIGELQSDLENYDDALARYEQASNIWITEKRLESAANAKQAIAEIYAMRSAYADAVEHYQEALGLLEALDEPEQRAMLLDGLAQAYQADQKLDDAMDNYAAASALWIDLQAPGRATRALRKMTDIQRSRGNLEDALGHSQKALELATEAEDTRQIATLQTLTADIAYGLESYSDAEASYQLSAASWEGLGDSARQQRSLRNAARSAGRSGQPELALDLYGQAIGVAEAAEDLAGQARLLDEIGNAYHSLDQTDEALTALGEAQAIWQNLDNQLDYAGSLVRTADIYRSLEDEEAALSTYRAALEIFIEFEDNRAAAGVYDTIGGYQREQGKYQEASDAYLAAAELWQEQERFGSQAKSLRSAARAYGDADDANAAIDVYQDAIVAAEENADKAQLASLLSEVGRAYQALSRYDDALDLLSRSRSIWSEVGDQKNLSETLDDIATVYGEAGDDEAAIATYQEALIAAQTAGELEASASFLGSLGSYYVRLRQYSEALEAYKGAEDAWGALGDQEQRIRALRSMAGIYGEQGDVDNGVYSFQAALELATELGDHKIEADILSKLSRHYQDFERYEDAISARRKVVAIWTELEEPAKLASALMNLAETYQKAGVGNAIVSTYSNALENATAAGDDPLAATIYDSLGRHYRSLEQYPEAVSNYELAAALWQSNDRSARLSKSLSAVGSIYAAQGNIEEATNQYLLALDAAKRSNDPADEANMLDAIGRHHASLKSYPAALDAYEAAYTIWASMEGAPSYEPQRAQSLRFRIWSTYVSLKDYATALTWATDPVGISSPQNGAVMQELVELQGLAIHPEFERWQIDLLPNGDEDLATFIGRSFRPSWGRLFTLDTTLYTNGPYTLRLRVIRDDKNYDEYMSDVVINNDLEALADRSKSTENGFTAPSPNSSAFGSLRIQGVADHDDFEKWELDLLLFGDEQQATHLQTGSRPSNGRLYSLDTQQFPNGSHTLRLRVVRGDSNYDEFFVNFTINN